jgi:hypothetical protein
MINDFLYQNPSRVGAALCNRENARNFSAFGPFLNRARRSSPNDIGASAETDGGFDDSMDY